MSDVGGPTANDLVNAMLAVGSSGISVVPGSVSYTGSLSGSGVFTNGGSDPLNSVGIPSGIILTSGDATFVSNVPNNDGGDGGDNGAAGSPLLSNIIGSNTFNASVLSFKFIPNGDKVQFQYIFGSEEYNNYVNSEFNDVFAFLVNGVNFALVPGTSVPVSINNVNCGGPISGAANHVNENNCAYFRDNPPGGNTIDTQLDGLTTVLNFVADVNPGVENEIVLGIADVGDTILDSAAFIKGNSFSVCGAPGQPDCAVPEPGTLGLTALGLVGIPALRRKKKADA
ncbi:MAG TPA: choice-of-anchor L domain-containing protein [Burkholderiales bacterium]|nr:choice-of-anchor L domain-containing protein [Burkholderiales bacterium]